MTARNRRNARTGERQSERQGDRQATRRAARQAPRQGERQADRQADRQDRGIPEATVARLPVYLRALTALSERGIASASSEDLAVSAGVNSAKLRKDLSYLGSYGTRGVGYDVEYLRYQIAREIGLTQDWPVVIVGIGNLGHALANYSGFASRGFRVASLVDTDPDRVGGTVGDLTIRAYADLPEIVRDNGVAIGVIATPANAAQAVCDDLVAAGVTSILNFAPAVLAVPPGVDVRKVDLSIELQILAYHEQRKAQSAQSAQSVQSAQSAKTAQSAQSAQSRAARDGSDASGRADRSDRGTRAARSNRAGNSERVVADAAAATVEVESA